MRLASIPLDTPSRVRPSRQTAVDNGRRGDRHVMLTVLSSLALQGMVVVTGIISARMLGPFGRGDLAIVLLWGNLLAAVGELGLQMATARVSARDPALNPSLLGLSLVAAVPISLVLLAAGWVIVWLTLSGDLRLLALAYLVITLPLVVLRFPLLGLLRGTGRFWAYNICRLLWLVPYIILLTWFWVFGPQSVTALLIANIITVSVSSLATIGLVLAEIKPTRFSRTLSREVFNFGLVVHLGTLASSETLRLDLMMVALLLSPSDLGIYVAASSIMFLPRLIGQSVGSVSLTERTSETEGTRGLIARRFRQTALMTGAVALVLVVISPVLMTVAFGQEFSGAGLAAAILVIGGAIVSVRRVLADSMRGAGHHVVSTRCEFLSLILSLVLLKPAIDRWGVEGAAVAFALAHLASFLVLLACSRRSLGLTGASLIPRWRDGQALISTFIPGSILRRLKAL